MSKSMSPFAHGIYEAKYAHDNSGRKERWDETAYRVVKSVMGPYIPSLVDQVSKLVEERKFMPGGRYLYAAGRRYPQVNNCFLFRALDCREGWGEFMNKSCQSLMTGGGIGGVYSDLRREGAPILGMGGKSTGPCALMQMVNEAGRHIVQGGSRRSAIWAGLHWNHPDAFKFIKLKEWPKWLTDQKLVDFNTPAPMDGTNISIILDDAFFEAYRDDTHRDHDLACDIYWECIRGMLKTGEPGFSVDIGDNAGENLRNACTEVTSSDSDDMCNLASLNMGRFDSLQEFIDAIPVCTAFLLCGTLYSKLPLESMYRIREKNRRLGLGLMGVHEWLLKRGKKYGADEELGQWLAHYQQSGSHAHLYSDRLGISRPVATRAVAPTGTISIIAETTSGIEPIFAAAYKRRYRDGDVWKARYVVDAAANRLIKDYHVDPDLVEDALTLAEDVERRMSFQGWMQKYVDHGISSTINLPPWGSFLNNETTVTRFGRTLLNHLPSLRGITAYPDGSRGGQPLTRISYHEAIGYGDVEFVDQSEESCKGGVCGA